MNVFAYEPEVLEEEFVADEVVIEPGLYNHPSGTKKYLVADDTEVVIVLQDGEAPRASNRWTKSKMADADADYFTFDESDGLVISN